MAKTNFKIFNEANDADKTFNDSEYENATQRLSGVTPGMAISRLHNKLFYQVSVMAKAIADFLVSQNFDCYDNQGTEISKNIAGAITKFNADNIKTALNEHMADRTAHAEAFKAHIIISNTEPEYVENAIWIKPL